MKHQNKAPGSFQIQDIDVQLNHHCGYNGTRSQHRSGPLHTGIHGVAHPPLAFPLAGRVLGFLPRSPQTMFLGCRERHPPNSTPLSSLLRDDTDSAPGPGVRVWMLWRKGQASTPWVLLFVSVKVVNAPRVATSGLCHWWGHQEGDVISQRLESSGHLSLTFEGSSSLPLPRKQTVGPVRDGAPRH